MRKFRLYFDKEKEEAWLNEMCSQGWAMTGFFLGMYTFVPCEFGKYTYQVDMPPISGKLYMRDKKKREYIEFVESTGAEYVCSWGLWLFFRKEAVKGEFKLYTDSESQIRLYQRVRLMFLLIGLYDLWVCMFNTLNFWNYAGDYLLVRHEKLLDLDGGLILVFGLAVVYLMTSVMLGMVARLTIKIRRLKGRTRGFF
ncbi:hypothetical protein C806_02582 [Lachnospiraceae bacterium 3-1]|nr:hypothetical protein C806_02582 [Lachnospiraceae bacterium 3-1]